MAVIVREKVKGSGEWWVFINHKGKRRSKKIGTKRAANNVKREVEARLAKGDLGMLKDKCPTVAHYGSKWVNSPIREWSDSTRSGYSNILENHIIPHFGSKRLDEIKRLDVKQLITSVHSLSSARKQTVLGVLSGIFSSAVEDEIVEVNPCQKMGKYCGNQALRDIKPLTADEVQTLLENASELPFEA
jgi:integrase